MNSLPADFIQELRRVLGDDTEEYIRLFDSDPFRGISVNRLKITPEELLPLLPFSTEKSPFYRDGYYISCEEQGVGRLPLHHAGAFYVQEPSASSVVSLLDVHPGDKVLDLCAAPGGKSAQIASCLGGSGLLWSNEAIKSRSQILLSNLERMGAANAVVSSYYPDALCSHLEGFFDRVLVDAPCSGEGMFRKNHDAITEWSREHVISCAERQLSILECASLSLKEGGTLVYSTCTFSPEENEQLIEAFLQSHDDFEAPEISVPFGRRTRLPDAVRITPMEGGEGHFAAVLRKKGEALKTNSSRSVTVSQNDKALSAAKNELSEIFVSLPEGRLKLVGDKLYILPDLLPDNSGLHLIRAGVYAGEFKKGRFEPAHSLFTAYKPSCFRRVLSLEQNDSRAEEFLKGFEIDCDGEKGYTAMAYCGMVMGFGKCSGGRLKNKYPKGLRLM